MIQNRVIAEFHTEMERAKQPGYTSRYDEDYDFDAGEDYCPSHDGRRGMVSSGIDNTRFDGAHAETEPRRPHRLPTSATRVPASSGSARGR